MKKKNKFYDKIDKSEDLEDNLQDLTDYLQEYTASTSVYVAKLVPHKNSINEDDDETAHVDENASLHLDIYHVSPEGFNFIQRKKIESNEGIVHDVFKEVEAPPQTEKQPPVETVEGEGEREIVTKEPEEPQPQHIIVPEVIREPRIKYFKVPRLGSLLCIRMNYDSCLSENVLDEALNDVYDCEARRRQQEIEKVTWEEQENKRREEAEKNDTEFQEEEKEWEDIKEKDYTTTPVDFAVCLDVMGQDRTYDRKQIDLALKAVSYYSKKWTEREKINLKKDIERTIERSDDDKLFIDRAKVKFNETEEKWIEQNTEEIEEEKDKDKDKDK